MDILSRSNLIETRNYRVSSFNVFFSCVRVCDFPLPPVLADRSIDSHHQIKPRRAKEMELATKAMEFANRAASNNTVINIFLVGAFGGLAVRSLNQQRQIEALESQRDSLVKSNKSMRQTIWEWKQKLYTEAEADKKPIVPLSKLKSIYGEVPTLPQSAGIGEKKDGKASATKIVI
ncbi:uncharacterized protein LOC111903510 [Lactuca sativa]|uniref:Uncharacterized protein n=1 Tax=Lactuca sativa TaxID=4236 RepID=A0A9R1VEB2_LACSA|nr:uncharacterized protein LOC111903510 [Lactuca sativa]KAJ0204598.1 hypothetical protein LSAT_V11C500294360 [Lactuca sativa]